MPIASTVDHVPIGDAASPHWTTWTSAERESFFDAVTRHRRASWRVTLVCLLCLAIQLVVVATLMAPLFYGLAVLACDLLNRIVPMPDLWQNIMPAINDAIDSLDQPGKMSSGRLLHAWLVAMLPGLCWMVLVTLGLSRVIRRSDLFSGGDLSALGRPAESGNLPERRLVNVTQEMALAAGLPAPTVLVGKGSAISAAIYGRDETHATIIVSEGALVELKRDQLSGIAAHLIGSMANGDLRIGVRVTIVQSLLGLLGSLSTLLSNRDAYKPLIKLVGCLVRPSAGAARELTQMLADPLGEAEPRAAGATATSDASSTSARNASDENSSAGGTPNHLTWQQWVQMPLSGPLALSGFFCAMVSLFFLAPMLAVAWRRRKYLADATAVRLTRDPNGLADALSGVGRTGRAGSLAPWLAHLAVDAPSSSVKGLLAGSFVPMFPSIERRLGALVVMGATPRPVTAKPSVWRSPVMLLIVPLVAVAAVLICIATAGMAVVSVMLSMMFTWLPVSLVHALLR